MPRLRYVMARRAVEMPEVDYHTILAGLHGDPCPMGGNPFLHIEATYPDRDGPAWPRIVTVFGSLPHNARKAIIHARRSRRARSRGFAA